MPQRWATASAPSPEEVTRRPAGSPHPADALASPAHRRLHRRPRSPEAGRVPHGAMSLARLLEGGRARSADPGLTVADLAKRIALGGRSFPSALGVPDPIRAHANGYRPTAIGYRANISTPSARAARTICSS